MESADAGEVRVLWGGPRGFAPAVGVPVGTMPYYRLGVGDVTGDGRPDVLVPGHGDSTVRVFCVGTIVAAPLRTAPAGADSLFVMYGGIPEDAIC